MGGWGGEGTETFYKNQTLWWNNLNQLYIKHRFAPLNPDLYFPEEK